MLLSLARELAGYYDRTGSLPTTLDAGLIVQDVLDPVTPVPQKAAAELLARVLVTRTTRTLTGTHSPVCMLSALIDSLQAILAEQDGALRCNPVHGAPRAV